MSRAKFSISADFLEHPLRPLFHVLLEPDSQELRGAILFLPPFADEMHMSRHVVASCARELAEAGYVVLLPDLTGCGDGFGHFSDASWAVWREDALLALDTLREKYGVPISLWGLRCGGLMAAQLAAEQEDFHRLVLWQPVLNGEQQIDQFLRLEAAATALRSGETFDRRALWDVLREGGSLEVAGYELPSRLALEMAQVRLGSVLPQCEVHWLDVSPSGSMSQGTQKAVALWQGQGVSVISATVQGEPFWRTIDASVNEELERQMLSRFKTP